MALWAAGTVGAPEPKAANATAVRAPAVVQNLTGDYDAEPRTPDGRVDVKSLAARLKGLGVKSYFWLIWHAQTDWEDLKLFLPLAAQERLQVWAYLVPPSESPPHAAAFSEPFRLDYRRWAEEIARLSLTYPNLVGWIIDDFYANHQVLSSAYVRGFQDAAKAINPRLAFMPLMYFSEITTRFANDYHAVIDGVVVAYPQDRDEIEQARLILNDAAGVPASELSFPWSTPSHAGDFVMASQTAAVSPTAGQFRVHFRERDDFTGRTTGYHFKQVWLDDQVVWEQDVAGGGGGATNITLDVSAWVRGKTKVTLAFRLFDKKGVSNFGVRWQLRDLQADGLKLASDLRRPQQWRVSRQGAFLAGFGEELKPGARRFHIPFIVMTAGQPAEFRMRHGDPATPGRIAEWLRMALQCCRDGQCDGVVTYCLDKQPGSPVFDRARELFRR